MKEFNKVIGYKDVKVELERIADMMVNSDKYKALGVKTTSGLLLYGEPGVGKTLMAKCLIKASKREAFTIRKDAPDGDFVKQIKTTFDEAKEKAPSIVFLDDVDKFANEDINHRNAEEFVTIQSCIDDCSDEEVFVIATANDLDNLPSSLLREGRFDKTIEVLPPTGKDAEEIIKYYLSSKKVAKDVDCKEIARFLDGRSCASLETVLNEAGVYSGFEGKQKIDMKDIIRAFMRVVYKAPEYTDKEDTKYLRNIAVHEAGHTVVAEILEPESVNIVTVKKHDGSIGGFTSYDQDENYFQDKQFMETRVMSLLAGRAATEIVYGKVDVGATSDLQRAFRVVERFVDDYCGYGFFFCEGLVSRGESNELLGRKTYAIQTEVERYYQMTKKILIDNRELLDKLTDALEKNKTLVYRDIQDIKKTCKLVIN